jgi:hypothetical protein
MPNVIDIIKGVVRGLTQIGVALIPLVLVVVVLFGGTAEFVTGDILGNLMDLMSSLGNNSLAGLIALAIVIWVFCGSGIFRGDPSSSA